MHARYLLIAILYGCSGSDKDLDDSGEVPTDDSGGAPIDSDGDGATADEDCDDNDARIYPGAEETCDGVDNDCDSEVDESGGSETYYADADLDGYGDDDASAQLFCDDPGAGYAAARGDCDDGDDAVNPDTPEICDSADNDCDGLIDALDGDLSDGITLYDDDDEDGYGQDTNSRYGCIDDGGVTVGGDCDDGDPAYNPGALESDCTDPNDYDCDGVVAYADSDADGYADCEECDDDDAEINPSAIEICDGVDNDCDGNTDEDDAADAAVWYTDADDDGFGDPDHGVTSCFAPAHASLYDTDCDDGNPDINPDATEICDGQDNDCDEAIDDADSDVDLDTATTWSYDYDDDGYGGDEDTVTSCDAPTSRYLAVGGDCDDEDTAYNPGADEGCDGNDYNCDGLVDNDADGDGYADLACGGDDCEDGDATVYPAASGVCPLGESCADILSKFPSSATGTYTIDIDGYETGDDPFDVSCDMDTDGGGWTQVLYWDAETDGDGTADIESLMVEEYNDMSIWGDKTGYIRWADNNATADAMSYRLDIDIPNSGDALFIYKFYGYSMDDSGNFFYVSAAGSATDLACHDNFTSSSYYTTYSSTERSYTPAYTCSYTTYGDTYTWDDETIATASGEIDAFYMRGFMYDTYGDYAYLYRMNLWVR